MKLVKEALDIKRPGAFSSSRIEELGELFNLELKSKVIEGNLVGFAFYDPEVLFYEFKDTYCDFNMICYNIVHDIKNNDMFFRTRFFEIEYFNNDNIQHRLEFDMYHKQNAMEEITIDQLIKAIRNKRKMLPRTPELQQHLDNYIKKLNMTDEDN
jgi:hypothetical protein